MNVGLLQKKAAAAASVDECQVCHSRPVQMRMRRWTTLNVQHSLKFHLAVALVTISRPANFFVDFFDAVNSEEQAELDRLFAEACYTAGWAFSCVDNPFVQDFLRKVRPAWHPPSAYKLSTTLLDATSAEVDQIVRDAIHNAPSVTLQLDGWSDVNRTSLVNIALYTGRPIFLKSIDAGVQRHDAQFIAQTMLDVINNKCDSQESPLLQGVDMKCKAVETDQPSVMQLVWDIVSMNAPPLGPVLRLCCTCFEFTCIGFPKTDFSHTG